MFKCFVPFQVTNGFPFDNPLDTITKLEDIPLLPCPRAMEATMGIVPVSPSGALLVTNRDQDVLCIGSETRKIPVPTLKRIVAQKCDEYKKSKGYVPGRKARLEIYAAERQRLMEMTIPSYAEYRIWIDRKRQRVIPLVGSYNTAAELVSWLGQKIDLFSYEPVFKIERIQFKLTSWLSTYTVPEPFTIGGSAVLKDPNETGMTVSYKNSPLSGEDVQIHLGQGKIVDALSFGYEGYKFTLNQKGEIKDVGRLGAKEEEHVDDAEDDDFRAQWCLFTEEIDECITSLDECIRE